MKILKKIVLSVHILAALPLLACYVAPHVNPASFMWLVPFTFVFHYVIAINIFFIFVWVLLDRRVLLFAIPLVLVGLPLINAMIPLRAMATSRPSGDNHFRLMTYNVHVFGLYNWRQKDVTKFEMFRYIEAEKPDIACFQEYFYDSGGFFPTTDSLLQILNIKNYHQVFTASSAKTQHFGIATFSRFPIVCRGELLFENTHNLCIYTDLVVDNDTIRVYNCHLQSMYFDEDNYLEMQQFSETNLPDQDLKPYRNILKKVLKASQRRSDQAIMLHRHVDTCPYHVIVCGDFNDNPFSYTYQKVSKGLRDSFSAAGKGFGYTWSQKGIKQRIDFVLYSDKFECSRHQAFKVPYSDHYPIVVSLGFKE